MNEDGSYKSLRLDNVEFSGRDLMQRFHQLARLGYFAPTGSVARQTGLDAMWYLWCGPCSPLFGKEKMTTFEQYFVEEKSTHKEKRNIYYTLRNDEATVRQILESFDLDADKGHVVNGHVPVIVKKKEQPIKAGGKLIVIDGGFSRAYQKKTGIAGYTLIFNSWGLLLATYQQGGPPKGGDRPIYDIDCTTETLESSQRRIRIRETDLGRDVQYRIDELSALLEAYQRGEIVQYMLPLGQQPNG
jgi:fructose-1,6-bisphosphatase-3